MPVKFALLALAALAALPAAQAETAVFTEYTVDYDDNTDFGFAAGSFSGAGFGGINWNLPVSVSVVSLGSLQTVTVDLPSFTVSAAPGYQLSNLRLSLGNLVFNQLDGASTQLDLAAEVTVDAAAPVLLNDAVDAVVTLSLPGYVAGYYAEGYTLVAGGFDTLALGQASLTLTADGGSFAAILGQPQNQLTLTLDMAPLALPVPEPETAAMWLAGLLTLGSLARRRRR